MSSAAVLQSNPNESRGRRWALATVVLWASSFPCTRIALDAFAPLQLAALRCAISMVTFLPLLIWLARGGVVLPRPRHAAQLLLCAVVGVMAFHAALNMGQTTISAGATSVIINTVPAITAVLAFLVNGERLGRWAWVGSGISLVGVMLIASYQPGGIRFGSGSLLVLLSAFLQGCYFLAQRPLIVNYGVLSCAAWIMTFASMLYLPWLPEAMTQWRAAAPRSQLALIYLGLVPSSLGILTWAMAQKRLGTPRAANFLYLVPPVTIAIAAFAVAELPSLALLAGGALAIAGVALVNVAGRRAVP